MAYTKTTTTGYGSRLSGAFKGIFVGIILFIAGTALLWWNEGRTVHRQQDIEGAASATVLMPDANQVRSEFDGKLVHVSGMTATKDQLSDPVTGVGATAIRLEREVEYFQWQEHAKTTKKENLGGSETTTTTYAYEQKWVSAPVDSGAFKDPEYVGKNSVIAQLEGESWTAANVTLDAYELPGFLVQKMSGAQALPLKEDAAIVARVAKALNLEPVASPAPAAASAPVPAPEAAQPAPEGAAVAQPAAAAEVQTAPAQPVAAVVAAPAVRVHLQSDGSLYLGVNPAQPAIGDMRVRYRQLLPARVSLIAQVQGSTFVPYQSKNGTFAELRMGDASKDQMIAAAEDANSTLCWFLRLLGIVLVVAGLRTVLHPLRVLAAVVPFIAKIIGAGLSIISTLAGLAWSFLVIAIAWIRFRPVLGVALLVAVGALVFFVIKKLGEKKAAAASGAEPPASAAA